MCYKITVSGLNGTDAEFTVKVLESAAKRRGYMTRIGMNRMSEARGDDTSSCLLFGRNLLEHDDTSDALIALNTKALYRYGKSTDGVIITGESTIIDNEVRARVIRVNTDVCNLGARFEGLRHMLMMGVWVNNNVHIDADDISRALSERLNIGLAQKNRDAMEYGMANPERKLMYA